MVNVAGRYCRTHGQGARQRASGDNTEARCSFCATSFYATADSHNNGGVEA